MSPREQVLSDYKVNEHGIIQSPGKFEGEMLYAPYFYDRLLDGCPDEDIEGVAFFVVNQDDRDEFPELYDVVGVALEETDTGFVYVSVFEDIHEYEAAIKRVEESIQESDEEEF